MNLEVDKAATMGLSRPLYVLAGDRNAESFTGDIQRAEEQDDTHQNFIKAVKLRTTDPDRKAHRHFTFRHKTDSSQDSRIDDTFICEDLCSDPKPSTVILEANGDADHNPILVRIALTHVSFVKPGPDPVPLPRGPRPKTPIPQDDLKEFKETFS